LSTNTLAAGNLPLTAEFAGDTYLLASNSTSFMFDVGKAEQSGFVFVSGSPTVKMYGDASFTVTASGGESGGAVTYEIVSGPATISGNTVSITGVGDIIIKATLAGGGGFNDATDTLTIKVVKAPLSVTADDADKVFGQPDPAFSYTVNAAQLKYGDTTAVVTGTATYSYGGTEVGGYQLLMSGLTAANYDITFIPGIMSINRASQIALTIVGGDVIQTYGETGVQLETDGGSGSGDVTWSSDTPALVDVDSDTGILTIYGATNGTVVTITAMKSGDQNGRTEL
jgi:hypothetical protein